MPDAVYKQAMDAVVTDIKGLSLTHINKVSVEARKFPWDQTYIHQGVSVSWGQVQYGYGDNPSTNERDMLRYPCIVTIVQGTGRGDIDDLNLVATWREEIFRTFNRKRLKISGSTDVNSIICWVEDRHVTLPQQYKKNYDALQMVVWAMFLEPRTVAT